MPESNISQNIPSGFEEHEPEEEYQALSGLAVVGLLTAVLGLTAIIWLQIWFVPAAAVVLSVLALRRIAQYSPALSGRGLAVAGLIVSVLSTSAVGSEWFGYRWLIRREARQVAQLWFECLRKDEPIKATQLAQDPRYRQPLAEFAADCRDEQSGHRAELKAYVAKPVVRQLLALGEAADVRYFQNEDQTYETEKYTIEDVYAVTYQDHGEKKTFFVRLTLKRYPLSATDQADWSISDVKGGIRPEGMEEGQAARSG